MSLDRYGVLRGTAISSRVGLGGSPHYQVHIVDDLNDYRIAVNVKSKVSPSELLYIVDDDFKHPITDLLTGLQPGFTRLASQPGGVALDFIRGNLFDATRMRPLSHDIPGPDNDLNEKIDNVIRRAIGDETAVVYAFGQRWGPEERKKDAYFGFLPGNGIHDIHMNQGNSGQFRKDNGVWQDGALIVHFPAVTLGADIWPEQWVAVFLAFQSQAWHTDDQTGDALAEPPPVVTPTPIPAPAPGERDNHIRIIAALVNPEGHDPGLETVTLLNTTPITMDLDGWSIADKNKRKSVLRGISLDPGETIRITLDGQGAQLSNDGGIISLLDAQGVKIDGVSYTRDQARKERWTLAF